MKTKRLDDALVEKGFAKDKTLAFVIVTEGSVFVGGQKAVSPAQRVSAVDVIEIRKGSEWVGRGGYKLEAALAKFNIDIHGKVCVDIGSATGGFVEVLLKRGAEKVYAIDTARGKLALKLREDPRVVVMEKTDIRDIESLPERIGLVTADVSLVSLRNILPTIRKVSPDAEVVVLFKPQYETRDPSILKHGVIKDGGQRGKLLEDFIGWAGENGWVVVARMESPIRGSEGNVEYVLYCKLARISAAEGGL